ncbi:myelin-associated glycoprotein-like isoform X1 [Notolabrus celidotus]|uniref:myelin-associated glycoprotein-like isoform X1 n=1 Tax=Notolabrus celidotus TaxID=1203425 RepID=UPI00148F5FC9|nr:myelin-associated glycoprotein-like isoform X1 [Notolabrus celidotus]
MTFSLLVLFLCFKVLQTEASTWTAKVPSSVKGLIGSCVVIPCTFDYANPGKTLTGFTGMWNNEANEHIYHSVKSKVLQRYQTRTELLGDISQKNCSLMIDPLQENDRGPFYFRIEIDGLDKFTYRDSPVSIEMIREPDPVIFSGKPEVQEGETVSASCSVSFSCPASPPVFNWSHSGEKHFQQTEHTAGQWKATSTLTFHPTRADHEKILQCTVRYKGGKLQNASKVLRVKYAPVIVKVEYKSDVKEGGAVQLKCSSDANPPASSYEWYNETGAQLYRGNVFTLQNVSRHTGDLYCTAINAMGQRKSSPVQLNVLHAPEIKTGSSCSSEADKVKCVCIAESRPPSMVHFVLSDRVLPKAKVEKHGPVTIGTLQAEFGSSEFVHCLAKNTQGTANLTLYFPVNSKMQNMYIYLAIGTGVTLVIVLIAVGVKKCRGRPKDVARTHLSTMKVEKDVEPPQYAAAKRKVNNYDDVDSQEVYANDPVYGNMETDLDDAIYANV